MERRGKLVIGIFALLFLTGVFFARADQFNDFYYIDPGGVPDLSEEGERNESGGGASGGGENGGSGETPGTGGGNSQGGGNTVGGTNGGSQGDGGSTEGNSNGSEGAEENALESLVEDGALVGGFGGVEGSILRGGEGSVVVNGARVRAYVRKDPDIDEILRYWKIGKGKNHPGGKTAKDRLTPGEYYALVAATLAADDELLEEARFTAHNFNVTYRSLGALFAFIPWSFPVYVSVEPHVKERVQVQFPWYHWFIREYFTRAELTGEINSIIDGIVTTAEEDEDIQAELFEAVALFLRQKVRTITDSIILQ